jgi:lipopolysaccharide/colanic/teichoic acid biosynthesis glycosyltransferase
MRIWPVILDSQPSYLRGRGRSASLLLAPLGPRTLIESVISSLERITRNAPLILAPEDTEPEYADWVHGLCPTAKVVESSDQFAEALSSHELSDALLIVDPRCMPSTGFEFSALIQQHAAEPRVSHHLVAFEAAAAGTKERVNFDSRGGIRAIQRHYEQATWPFIAGISATVVPFASGIPADGLIPRSLVELRQVLAARGVPSRDVPLHGVGFDLNEEFGMLAANEQLICKATSDRKARDHSSAPKPMYVGAGHAIHTTARFVGPVVVHAGAWIGENATILGPAVIGAGAHIGSGAVVAHATIGPDSVVAQCQVVRDRAWFRSEAEDILETGGSSPVPYAQRLSRLTLERGHASDERQETGRRVGLHVKRGLDFLVAAVSLIILSPLFAVIAAVIRLESKGPVFYGDKREGMGGRHFGCWKFRTMFTGAHLAQMQLKALDQTDGPHFKMDRDPRVTKVGQVLRALNLDEIPQLFNVLVGEMSLVGPRPSPFRENQVCVPWREARLSVRPGITGFWQVCRHNRSAGDFHQWIEYDLLYVQHLSLALDAKILTATLLTLGGKAAHIPASWLTGQQAQGSAFMALRGALPSPQAEEAAVA